MDRGQSEGERLTLSCQTQAVHLAGATNQTVVLVITQKLRIDLCNRMASHRQHRLSLNFASDLSPTCWRGQSNARIPARVLTQPRECFSTEALHRDGRKNLVELVEEVTNPAVRQDDVGIENLAGHRVNSAGADGRADVVVQPANEVVPDVFRIKLHVPTGLSVLVINFDRVQETDLFVSLVPVLDALRHPAAVTHRHGVLEDERDWLNRRAEL